MAITEKYASSAGAGAKNGTDEANAWDWATMLTDANAGDRINFKGNHTLGGAATFTNPGTTTSPIILRGYSSTIGDLANNTRSNGGSGLLDTTGYPVISGDFAFTSPNLSIVESIKFSNTLAGATATTGTYAVFYKCTSINGSTSGSSAISITVGTGAFIVNCDGILNGTNGNCAISIGGGIAINCIADGGPAIGIKIGSNGVAIDCIAYSSASDGIQQTATTNFCCIYGCTIVSNSSDGFHLVTGPTRLSALVNNLITDNTGNGIYSVDAAAGIFSAYNRIDRNSAAYSGATDWLTATKYSDNITVATQANEYQNAAGDDYRLKPASPAISNGLFPYIDIGAIQRQKPRPGSNIIDGSGGLDG